MTAELLRRLDKVKRSAPDKWTARWPAHHDKGPSLAIRELDDARVKRSQSAKVEFKQEHPCPATGARKGPCKGYVIDHVNPLAYGGPDALSNMQWQTVAEGKAKDKWERKQCGK